MRLPTNAPSLKSNRKLLRKNQTLVEFLLWSKLRNKQFLGIKFYRQYGIGPFIVDFYSFQHNLVIELDGGQHNEIGQRGYDFKRAAFLAKQGIKVIRFWDNEVIQNIQGVLEAIQQHLKKRNSP